MIKKAFSKALPMSFLWFVPSVTSAAGIMSGIEAGRALALLGLVWGMIALTVGSGVAYLIYKKTKKKWAWVVAPIGASAVFVTLWVFSLSPHSKSFFSVVNSVFGTNY